MGHKKQEDDVNDRDRHRRELVRKKAIEEEVCPPVRLHPVASCWDCVEHTEN